jgi:predicted transcriptional regulator
MSAYGPLFDNMNIPKESELKLECTLGEFNDICKNYHRDNPQSVQANKKVNKFAQRIRILNALELSYDLTCEELEDYIGLSHQSCSARLSELKREGKIRKIGVRNTRSGSPAAVYQAI